MSMDQRKFILSQLEKALGAEEKMGFANTGAFGGFNSFLKGISARMEQVFPDLPHQTMRRIAMEYPTWGPNKRREAFSELWQILSELRVMTIDSALSPQEQKPLIKANGNETYPRNSRLPKEKDLNKIQRENQVSLKDKAGQTDKTDTTDTTDLVKTVDQIGRQDHVSNKQPKSLQYVKGVGPERYKQLEKLGIHSTRDLLLYYPRRYENRKPRLIYELKDGEMATITGKIIASNISHYKTKVIKFTIEQQERIIIAVFFNQTFLVKQFPVGITVTVSGKVRWQQRTPELVATDISKAKSEDSSSGILPVYSETGRLNSKVIRTLVKNALPEIKIYFPEFLPSEDLTEWMERSKAYQEIHFPSSFEDLKKARQRLVWEEILFLQLAVARLREGKETYDSPVLAVRGSYLKKLIASLPFTLTKAQSRVIEEISRDMAKNKGMARLVQGDVGSGKTIIAMFALLQAVESGYQGAMMAPTEILAMQHFQSINKTFKPLGIKVVLLSGSQTKSEREETLRQIADGSAEVIVGTHALIQESVCFRALGLAVTDEQHRFGVRQRTMLQSKGESPHVLVLTATPIPRTLALTLYGDLQLSVVDQMPAGRKPIITRRLTERGRSNLEKFLGEQMHLGRQIYVVCPLVEDSEALDLISATKRTEELIKRFPDKKIALLHGRMKGSEKKEIMKDFQNGEIDILVATTVVEVGVNVPNASVMVIESAERFGLAQLHQLRGRVGRGSEQSYCILVSDAKNSRRLDVLCQTQDGFKIAEEDLRIRGSGELLGTRQHGLTELKLANLAEDGQLVEKAYQLSQKVISNFTKYEKLINEVNKAFPPEEIGVH